MFPAMFFAIFMFASIEMGASQKYKIVCYFPSWASTRPGAAKFTVNDVDANLCTHIIYSFAILNETTYKISMSDPSVDRDGYVKFTNLKQKNANLKTMIAIGGWTDSQSPKYANLVQNQANIKGFAAVTVKFLRQHKFDGLDLDWEHPKTPQQKSGFVNLLRELKSAFRPFGLLLTAAVGSSRYVIDNAYNISGMAPHVDFINLMSYDFHGSSWEPNTADHHSRLLPRYRDSTQLKELCTDAAVQIWTAGSMPKNKIVIGMPTYGQSWTLQRSDATTPPAPAVGPGQQGTFTRSGGSLAYYEICEKIYLGWTAKEDFSSPYAYQNNQWVGYDNVASIERKANYIKSGGYGGGMIWELSFDDFKGVFCGAGKYPLLSKLKAVLG